jgi:two-component system response regulator HydG
MAETAFVLIVEDQPEHADAMGEALRRVGHACRISPSAEDAIDSMETRLPDVVVTDYKLGGAKDGIDVLRAAKRLMPPPEVVLVTAYGDEQLCRDALKTEGAFDYLLKPLDVDSLRSVVNQAARRAIAGKREIARRERLDTQLTFDGVIGASPKMARLLDIVHRVADTKLTVLITGESGAGKELIARAIHENSSRRKNVLKAINCAGLSETLLESELFGHVKGAYTGAASDHKGLFEYADGGTLFLDEIGDMPLPMQAKLLRVLENGEVVPVGSNEGTRVDVRFIAATNRDLRTLVDEKNFREDVYHRINNVVLAIPPLRERREDVPVLVEHYLNAATEEFGKSIEEIDPEAMRMLTTYAWPGNVRELIGVIQRMVVFSAGSKLTIEDVPEEVRGPTELAPVSSAAFVNLNLEHIEREAIRLALQQADGNRERAAQLLGIPTRTLYRRLQKYELG